MILHSRTTTAEVDSVNEPHALNVTVLPCRAVRLDSIQAHFPASNKAVATNHATASVRGRHEEITPCLQTGRL
jgi:hypothetical protein